MDSAIDFLGRLCKVAIPIHEEKYHGNNNSNIAICTLSSIQLLKRLADSDIVKDVAVIGRLLSENKGIDALIKNTLSLKIQTILICGKEVKGHRTGHSLLMLHKNGVDNQGNIIESTSPRPYLSISKNEIEQFRKRVVLVNRIGEENAAKVTLEVKSLKNQ